MSITLNKIELWNIRCHKHFLFSPDKTGITSVSGANGAGKSTIVDAFAWALYGTKTNNTKNKELIREGVSTKTDYVGVEVELTVNNIEYRIKRSIVGDSGGADCNVYGRSVKSDDEEFRHLAGPAISSGEKFIKQILKMDEKGFLTAVLIQQKQVDQIVSSSPRDRGAVIEKLTGIQSITNAITIANQEARQAQKTSNVLALQDTASLEVEIKDLTNEGISERARFDQYAVEIESLQNALNTSKTDLLIYKSQNDKANLNKTEQKINDEKIKLFESERKSLAKVTGDNDNITLERAPDIKPLELEVKNISRDVLEMENSVNRRKVKINKLESESAKLLSSYPKNKKEYTDELKKINSDKVKKQERVEFLVAENQSLKGSKTQVNKYLGTLSDDIHECPICKSTINNAEELKLEIEKEIELINTKEKSNTKEIKSTKSVISSLTEKELEITNAINSLKIIEENSEITKAEIQLINELETKLESSRTKQLELDSEYKSALNLAARVDEVHRAINRIAKLDKELSNLKEKRNLISSNLIELIKYSNEEFNLLAKEQEKKTQNLNKIILTKQEAEGKLSNLRIQVKSLKDKLNSAIENNSRYNKITSKMKDANVASSIMSEFKENRIKFSIPALEMYASTILSKFTEGKFVKLELDSKFNTFVTTDSGVRRPIAKLSGGELSATAIALRIGISMLLNEGDNNVLILDEILVSMDESRARHIIETITSITNCQVIFIAHNTDIKNIADHTVFIN